MWCGIVTLFPEMFKPITQYGVTGRAVKDGLLTLEYWDPRDFATDKHKTVDDRPYGGGPGMVMCVAPLKDAIHAARKKAGTRVKTIYVSPQGKRIHHQALVELAQEENLIFVAGRYEGVDERLLELEIDEEWSIGDYVLSGGEIAIMAIIDALSRFIPGVLGDESSAKQDSFVDGWLEYPQYTRPEEIAGLKVPKVLLSGDHAKIEEYRLKQSLGRTYERRPDLLEGVTLTEDQQKLLKEFLVEKE